MAPTKKLGQWIKPTDGKRRCGCVYSIIGYAIYFCPKHAAQMKAKILEEEAQEERINNSRFGVGA